MPTLIADYVDERALFAALLRTDTPERILLFRGASGTGKSTLLRACREAVPTSIFLVPFEFKGTGISLTEIFYRTAELLGWERFPSFVETVEDLAGPRTVKIESNRLIGINQKIEVVLSGERAEDQEHRLAELTRAWFSDLQRLPQDILFLFDTYEQALTPVRQWLAGPFLARAAGNERVRTLLAGQAVPDHNNIEWGYCCQMRELKGVGEAAHWLPVIDALNRHIAHPNPHGFLAGICYTLGGRPDAIMNVIETLPERVAAT